MADEIGGEFYTREKESFRVLPDTLSVRGMLGGQALLFESGRSAIMYFYGQYARGGKILLPEYCCRSMAQGIPEDRVAFYGVHTDLSVDIASLERTIAQTDAAALLFMNCFGFLQPPEVFAALYRAKNAGVKVLEDTTHSFFTAKRTAGDYCVCSFRKWFALPGGAAFYGAEDEPLPSAGCPQDDAFYRTRAAALARKGEYMAGKTDGSGKEAYLSLFREAEELLDGREVPYMASKGAALRLCCESRELMISRRRANFQYLQEHIRNGLVRPAFRLRDASTAPMFFPVYCDGRDRLRQALTRQEIYCPVHWPAFAHSHLRPGPEARYIAGHILSLPIDQRYVQADMARVADAVNGFDG